MVHEGEPSWHQRRAGHISAAGSVFTGPDAKRKAYEYAERFRVHHPDIRTMIQVQYRL